MQATIEFILKLSLFWGISLLWYQFFLRKQKRFNANRIFLLTSLLFSVLLVNLPAYFVPEPVYSYNLMGGPIRSGSEAIAQPMQSGWPLWLALLLVGIGLGLLRLFVSLWQLRKLLLLADKQDFQGHKLLRTLESSDCYTFFGYIVVGDQIEEEDLPCMIEHERAHRRYGHSLDILLAEFFCILFWFNPLVYIYKFLLLEVHEYQADKEVLSHYSLKSYANLLLQRAMNTRVSLFHTFSTQSQLKKRLNMMTNLKNQNNQSWEYWLAIPLMIAMVIAFIAPQANAQVVEEPDEMPVYGDCSGDADAVKKCSMTNLITDMIDQIEYPKEVKAEGKVFIQFVVAKNGKVKDAKVLKALDPACDAEALRVVKSLNKWKAGKKEGKKVAVKMVLPIAFKKA